MDLVSARPATLRDLLVRKSGTITAFAAAHGFSRVTLQRWATGTHTPHAQMVIKLAESLGVDVDVVEAAVAATAATKAAGGRP